MPKYRVVARVAYYETSELIEADSPEEAVRKAETYLDVDDSIPQEYVDMETLHEVYEVNDSGESPPPTWMVNSDGTLDKWD